MTSARQSRPVIILFRLRHPESHNGDTDDMSQPIRGEECGAMANERQANCVNTNKNCPWSNSWHWRQSSHLCRPVTWDTVIWKMSIFLSLFCYEVRFPHDLNNQWDLWKCQHYEPTWPENTSSRWMREIKQKYPLKSSHLIKNIDSSVMLKV